MTLDDLRAYGANVDEGLARVMGMESFFLNLVDKFYSDDESMDSLFSAMRDQRYADAFSASHALKGVASNLSITPLSEPIGELCEMLRPPRPDMTNEELLPLKAGGNYDPLLAAIESAWERFKALS